MATEKIKANTKTMIQKFDGNMNLEDVHESNDAKTPSKVVQITNWGPDAKEVKE